MRSYTRPGLQRKDIKTVQRSAQLVHRGDVIQARYNQHIIKDGCTNPNCLRKFRKASADTIDELNTALDSTKMNRQKAAQLATSFDDITRANAQSAIYRTNPAILNETSWIDPIESGAVDLMLSLDDDHPGFQDFPVTTRQASTMPSRGWQDRLSLQPPPRVARADVTGLQLGFRGGLDLGLGAAGRNVRARLAGAYGRI